MTTAKVIDFSNVKDSSGINPRQVPAGDYLARVVKVEDAKSKKDDSFQYLFTIKLEKYSQNSYPYYCKLQENQLWKLRNLLIAAGMNVPKKRLKLDPSKIVGKAIGVTMEDDEYEGKLKSVVASVFPAAELSDDIANASSASYSDDDDDVADDDEAGEDDSLDLDDLDTQTAASADEDEDEEDEEDEAPAGAGDEFDDMDRAKLKRFIKSKQADYSVKRSQSDDDLREVARGLAKPAATKPAAEEDDELEELDIDDL